MILASFLFQNIVGEVYRVDDEMLSNLDILENHPQWYVRRQERVQIKFYANSEQEGTETILAWIYFLPNFKRTLLTLPLISNYSSSGEHGRRYVERYKRIIPDYSPKIDILL